MSTHCGGQKVILDGDEAGASCENRGVQNPRERRIRVLSGFYDYSGVRKVR